MKNKLTLISLLALFLIGTYTVYAQDSNDTITEEVNKRFEAAIS